MKVYISNMKEQFYEKFSDSIGEYVERRGGRETVIEDVHDRIYLLSLLEYKNYNRLFFSIALNNQYNLEKINRVTNLLMEIEGYTSLVEEGENMRSWPFARAWITLEVEEIYYFRSYQRKMTVYTYEKDYRIKTTINEEENKLMKQGFIRVHQGYLVKKDRIRKMKEKYLILKNGHTVPVSRRYMPAVMELLRLNLQ